MAAWWCAAATAGAAGAQATAPGAAAPPCARLVQGLQIGRGQLLNDKVTRHTDLSWIFMGIHGYLWI